MNALDTESEHQIVGGLGRKELDESAPAKDDTLLHSKVDHLDDSNGATSLEQPATFKNLAGSHTTHSKKHNMLLDRDASQQIAFAKEPHDDDCMMLNPSLRQTVDQEKNGDISLLESKQAPDERDIEDEWSLSCWQKLRFFLKQTCKDISRHKCQFCLSFCSVFIVVLSVLIVVSITQKGPIVFFRLAEKGNGQWDGVIAPTDNAVVDYSDWLENGEYLNFTQT